MSVNIQYNGQNVFSDLGTTPFISFSQNFIDYKNKWDQVTRLTLTGQLKKTQSQSLSELLRTLLNRFSTNYGSLSITSDGGSQFSSNCVIIDSINIDESNWYEVLPYTINIDIYEQNLFTNYFGIIEPEEKIELSENEEQNVSLRYIVSAKGLKISPSAPALQNAKTWVLNKINNFNPNSSNLFSPIKIKSKNQGSDFLLESKKENIDRFNSVYSCELNYIKSLSPFSKQNCLFQYNVNVDYNDDEDFVTVTINGSFQKNSPNILQATYNSTGFFQIASEAVSNFYGSTSLNPKPIQSTVQLFENEEKLEFSISYNSDLTPNIINDYSINVQTDNIKYITNVSINGTISAKYGDAQSKWNQVQRFYNSFDGFSIAFAEYNSEVSAKPLNSTPITESVSFDEKNAQIKYNITWSNKIRPYSNNILNMNLNVSYRPSVKIYVPLTSAYVPTEHNIQDLGCASFANLTINASATAKPVLSVNTIRLELASKVNNIVSNYIQGPSIKQNDVLSIDEENKTLNISQNWEFQGTIITS